jgi:hypothetical protein
LAYVLGKLTYFDFNQIQSWAFTIETQCRTSNLCEALENLPTLEKLIKEATGVIQTRLASIGENISNNKLNIDQNKIEIEPTTKK